MSLSEREQEEIDRANESGRQPVAFVHGLWLLSSSWDRWRTLFESNGYATIAPGWPDDPETVAEARDHPDVFAHKMVQAVTDHYLEAIAALTRKPGVVGHSFGGLIAQKIAGVGASAVTVAIDPAPGTGVLPLPVVGAQVRLSDPRQPGERPPVGHPHLRGVHLRLGQRPRRGRGETAVRRVPRRGVRCPDLPGRRGEPEPLQRDQGRLQGREPRTAPHHLRRERPHGAARDLVRGYKKHRKNVGVTEFTELAGRGHSLTIDHGWQEVAETALDFVRANGPAPA